MVLMCKVACKSFQNKMLQLQPVELQTVYTKKAMDIFCVHQPNSSVIISFFSAVEPAAVIKTTHV